MYFDNHSLCRWLIVALLIFPGRAGTQELAIGWTELPYAVPEPGSYRLPSLGAAMDGEILDDEGIPHRLLDLADDKVQTS